jgi:DNA-binding HxlR family transcriptional regulator
LNWRPQGPFFWVPKDAFEKIEENLERGPAASAKLVYVALCIVANRENTPTFSKPINYLVEIASLERRTIERRLPDLERLGLIQVQRAKLHAPHTYTITTLSRNVATARSLQPVALPKEQKEQRERPRPLNNVERISADKLKADLQQEIKDLKAATSEPWQRQQHPERLSKLQDAQAQLEALTERLAIV